MSSKQTVVGAKVSTFVGTTKQVSKEIKVSRTGTGISTDTTKQVNKENKVPRSGSGISTDTTKQVNKGNNKSRSEIQKQTTESKKTLRPASVPSPKNPVVQKPGPSQPVKSNNLDVPKYRIHYNCCGTNNNAVSPVKKAVSPAVSPNKTNSSLKLAKSPAKSPVQKIVPTASSTILMMSEEKVTTVTSLISEIKIENSGATSTKLERKEQQVNSKTIFNKELHTIGSGSYAVGKTFTQQGLLMKQEKAALQMNETAKGNEVVPLQMTSPSANGCGNFWDLHLKAYDPFN